MIIARYKPWLRWPALMGAGVLALSRLPTSAHYWSDVMVGYLIGTLAIPLFARWLASCAIVFIACASATFPKMKKLRNIPLRKLGPINPQRSKLLIKP